MEDIHPGKVPEVAERPLGGHCAIAKCVEATRIAHLGPVGKPFGDAERLNVANHRRSVDEVVTDSRMRKELSLLCIDHVGCRRQKSAGLTFQR